MKTVIFWLARQVLTGAATAVAKKAVVEGYKYVKKEYRKRKEKKEGKEM